jgi:hypothetical protein
VNGRVILHPDEINWDYWELIEQLEDEQTIYRHKPTGALAYKQGACLLLLATKEATEILARYQAKRTADIEMLAPEIRDALEERGGSSN